MVTPEDTGGGASVAGSDDAAFLTGTQVLVRLPLEQSRRDRAAGLNTAGFISGYRGSPLGGYDQALWKAQRALAEAGIVFRPAINEEMAATAVIGSQQVPLFPGARHDGVFALWYGKGPGLDRAGDALKHANSLGSSPKGGVLVVVGDDHGAMSSSMAHQSEQLMMSWMMPVLCPAGLQDYLDLGLMGFALSRYSGCYAGFVTVSETVESSAMVSFAPRRPAIVMPPFDPPPGGLHIRFGDPQLAQEDRLQRHKLRAAQTFARANRLDRLAFGAERPRLGIMAAGKAWLDLRQALDDLGVDCKRAAALGLGLYKVGMTWPLEPEGALAFARGTPTVLVVEEKRGVIEPQLKELCYRLPASERPEIIGKTDESGRPLLSSCGELSPEAIARVLIERLELAIEPGPRDYLKHLDAKEREIQSLGPPGRPPRPPFFCSGCPHNGSTRVPEGSRAMAGTGCHVMAAWMPRDTNSVLHMGAEGVNWMGIQPFSDMDHIFQNLGDGTYVHSGSTAIRQAVAAGLTITYKILYNDAVAMTGGQPLDGHLDIARITHQLRHEGVDRIALVSDDPGRHRPRDLVMGATLHHRSELDAVQRELRRWPGVSVLIFDQVCAAELRRRRRKGEAADRRRRVVINQEVCEGCGDCLRVSNCVSVTPVATPQGIKRHIDQSSCNQDFTCAEGFCPSFVMVEGERTRPPALLVADWLPPPPAPPPTERPWGILVAGIGGTGVVTITQIIGHAACFDGKAATVLDFNGLAQKGGGVLGYVRIADDSSRLHAPRLAMGGADALIAADMVVAGGPAAVSRLRRGRTRAVVNGDVAPTAASVLSPDAIPDVRALRRAMSERLGADSVDEVAATTLSRHLSGDSLFTNILLLGYAFQRGLIPLSEASLHAAIRLNGVAVAENLESFAWGRRFAHDFDKARQAAGLPSAAPEHAEPSLGELVADNVARLAAYHDEAYAARYRVLVETVERADSTLPDKGARLSLAVARSYAKLLAFKDQYEVARQLSDPRFIAGLGEQFEGKVRLRFLLGFATDDETRPRKLAFGPWLLPVLRLLARLRRLRGGVFDPFRFGAERRLERRLIARYEADMAGILRRLSPDSYDAAVELAALPDRIRGFGPVKRRSVREAETQRAELLARLGEGRTRPLAAE